MVVAGKVEMFLIGVLCLPIATIPPLRLFLKIYTQNMGQNTSLLHHNIVALPRKPIATILSFACIDSEIALAHTCKRLYKYHKKQCGEQLEQLLHIPKLYARRINSSILDLILNDLIDKDLKVVSYDFIFNDLIYDPTHKYLKVVSSQPSTSFTGNFVDPQIWTWNHSHLRQISYVPLSVPTTEQTSLIVIFPYELIAMLSSKDQKSALALARTCKTLYGRYEQYYEKQTAVVLYDPWDKLHLYNDTIKALSLQNGWLRLKFVLISNSQNNNCPVKILCLGEGFNVLPKFDYARIHAVIVSSFTGKFIPTISFAENFSNLRSLCLNGAVFNGGEISMISRLPLLKFISLRNCKMTNIHPSKIFENCATLQEIQLLFFKTGSPYETSLKFPSWLNIFKIRTTPDIVVDASFCIQYSCL